MRANAAGEDGVAVVEQMMGRKGGGGEAVRFLHVLRGLQRSDVLEHNFELGKITPQGDELGVDEHRLAIENIDLRRCHFTMHQQRHAGALHGFQRAVGVAQVGDTGVAVGGGARRVELGRHHAGVPRVFDFIGRQVVGEVERHQRLELNAVWHRRLDARLVGQRCRRRRDRWPQVGHDDGATKLGRGVRHHCAQGVAITHVQVPVVGSGQVNSLCHDLHCPKCRLAAPKA